MVASDRAALQALALSSGDNSEAAIRPFCQLQGHNLSAASCHTAGARTAVEEHCVIKFRQGISLVTCSKEFFH